MTWKPSRVVVCVLVGAALVGLQFVVGWRGSWFWLGMLAFPIAGVVVGRWLPGAPLAAALGVAVAWVVPAQVMGAGPTGKSLALGFALLSASLEAIGEGIGAGWRARKASLLRGGVR